MADKPFGPVRPPVIEGTARAAATDRLETERPLDPPAPAFPEAEPAAATAEPDPVAEEISAGAPPAADDATPGSTGESPAAPARRGGSAGPALAGLVGGALLGAGLAYGLASLGYWPDGAGEADDGGRVAALEQRLAGLAEQAEANQAGLAAMNARIGEAAPADLPAQLTGLTDRLAALEATAGQAPGPAPDLAPLNRQIAELSARVDALGNDAATEDGAAMEQAIAGLREEVARLGQALPGLEERAGTGQAAIEDLRGEVVRLGEALPELDERTGAGQAALETLRGEVDQLRTALAAEADKPGPVEAIGPVLRLPMVLSGLETAFATGRPFAAELESLRTILPDLAVPPALAAAAPTGLVEPDRIEARFREALPEIIAARPADPAAPWHQAVLDWGKNVLAVRPSGEIVGEDPAAQVGRIEAALERDDLTAAAELFAALPEPMRAAAGDMPAQLAAQADAARFVAELRRSALTAEAGQPAAPPDPAAPAVPAAPPAPAAPAPEVSP